MKRFSKDHSFFHLAHSKCAINDNCYYSYSYYFGRNSNGAKLIQSPQISHSPQHRMKSRREGKEEAEG